MPTTTPTTSFPLSKTLDPADFDELALELRLVDPLFARARPQHPMRRWEYALALRAFDVWGGRATHTCVDVGGAGSPFWRMLPVDHVIGVDPEEGRTLAEYLATRPPIADAVFCLSVLEHVEDLDQFLYHLSCLVAPGGLLVLTMDYCDDCATVWPADRYHFHWMRQRIFSAYTLGLITHRLIAHSFSAPLGTIDFTWHGPQVYDYTFASLVLTKRA